MSRLKVLCFSVSIDGFGAGPSQDLEHPLGVCGPWPDESWRGWWGDEPPYHCPVFVLMGRDEQLLGGLDLTALGYTCTR